MNLPCSARCHVNVAGVGQQSVWGLRIIACDSSSLLHHSSNSSRPKMVGGPGVKPRFAASEATVLFNYTTHPLFNYTTHQSGTRAGNRNSISFL